jgi:hypothetical protein
MFTQETKEVSGYRFSEAKLEVPDHDMDLSLVFPNGKTITVQIRPSNADFLPNEIYEGSIDIILPENQCVTNWKGDDMEPGPQAGIDECCRVAKQLVFEIPPTNVLSPI